MGTDQGDVDPGSGAADQDRISDLPDHLLHDILIHLPSTADAARTSTLSRRWRRVWADVPVISFDCRLQPLGPRALDRVDAALAAHSAGAGTAAAVCLSRLVIALPCKSRVHLRMDRVAAWLHVASLRLAGELQIMLPPLPFSRRTVVQAFFRRTVGKDDGGGEEEALLLPPCERATSISLDVNHRNLRFAAGVFKALATLSIRCALLRGRELGAAVSSSRCPCLKKLVIEWFKLLPDDDGGDGAAPAHLFICSDSLERLEISYAMRPFHGQLRVHAPELRTFHLGVKCDVRLLAPKLSEVRWFDQAYDSGRHHLAHAGHQLRRLEVEAYPPGFALMRQFNTVDELVLTVHLRRGVEEYERFLKYTDKLAKCKVLLVKFEDIEHGLKPAMLHLLSKCAGIRRLVVHLGYSKNGYPCKLSWGCPCSQQESCKTQNVVLDSLEEAVINGHAGDIDHKVELVRLLCRCTTTSNKKVAIAVSHIGQTDYARKKILSICRPNDKTEITIRQFP